MKRRAAPRTRAFRYRVEAYLARGPFFKLLVVWSILAVITVIGGGIAYLTPSTGHESLLDAMWWAFLRLSDPGYLSEEEETGSRIQAVVLTVIGLAVFVGALVAILTQWLDQYMDRLALGLTPITENDHVVVLGWTSRTPELLACLLPRHVDELPVVAVLVDRITPEVVQEIGARLGSAKLARHVILRSGDVRQEDHLARVNIRQARAIIVPAEDQRTDAAAARDTTTAKVVASLAHDASSDEGPAAQLAVEISQPSLAPVLAASYPGQAYVVPTDVIVGRSIAQGVVSPGLSSLYADMLDPREGGVLLSRQIPELVGRTVHEAAPCFRFAVIMGARRVVESGGDHRWLGPDEAIEEDDRLVLLVPHDEQPQPGDLPALGDTKPIAETWVAQPTVGRRRVLILGWSEKVPQILGELAEHRSLETEVEIVARRDVPARERSLRRVAPSFAVKLRHVVSDPASPEALAELRLDEYTSIVLVASDGHDSPEAADTHTIATHLILEHQLAASGSRAHIVVELLDPANASLFERGNAEIVQTSVFMADTLAGMVTQPDLTPVLSEAIAAGMTVEAVGLDELALVTPELNLYRLDERLRRDGLVLMGLQRSETGFELELAPDKEESVRVRAGDHAIVLRTGSGRQQPTESREPS